MTVPFDTLELVKELEDAGFNQEEAEGLVHGLAKALAKYDLATKQDLIEMEHLFKQDLDNLGVVLRSDMKNMEVSLRVEIGEVKKAIGMLKWLMSGLIFGTVLLLINAYWID